MYNVITVICDVRDQDSLMAYLTLLFIVILATVSKVTSLHCSDQQLPASDDDDDLLPYTTAKLHVTTVPSEGLILERSWTLSTLLIVSLLLPQRVATLLH